MRNARSENAVDRYFAAIEEARPFGLRFESRRDRHGGLHDVLYVANELIVTARGLLSAPAGERRAVSERTAERLGLLGGERCEGRIPEERRREGSRLGQVQVWRFGDRDGNPRDARRVLGALRALDGEVPDTVALHHGFVAHQKMHPGEDPEKPPADYVLPPPDAGSRAGEGVRIAVLDSGCTIPQADDVALAGVSGDAEVLLVPGLADPSEQKLAHSAGHGTFIASLIKQVAPRAVVHVGRVLDELGVTTEARLVEALSALPDDVHIVSLSLGAYAGELSGGGAGGGGGGGASAPQYLGAAILDLLDRGVAVVASAGNDGVTAPTYPAAYDGVVGVAALERDGHTPWVHTNRGGWVRACAVGADLRGVFVDGDEDPYWEDDCHPETWHGAPAYATWSGTSFAAPLVAGTIAARLSEAPGATPRDVADAVVAAGAPGPAGCGAAVDVALPIGV